MSNLNSKKLKLKNSLDQLVRTYNWSHTKIVFIHRHDTGRVEAVKSTIELVRQGVPFETIASSSLKDLNNKPLSLGKYGQLSIEADKDAVLSPSQYGVSENPAYFKKILKNTTITHLILLFLIFTFSWTYNTYFKQEQEIVKVQPKQRVITTMVVKKVAPVVTKKVVKASKKTINRKKRVRRSYTRKKPSLKRKTRKRRYTLVKSKKRTRKNINSLGALGAIGSLKKSKRGGQGLNLKSSNKNSGSGTRLGVGSKGISKTRLSGKGLIARSAGRNKTIKNKYGYGTKGRAGGRSSYGKHTISGGSGSYFHPLQEVSSVVGGLEKSQIAAVVNRNIGQVIYCYEKGLQKRPSLTGRVAVSFIISGKGRVSKANIASSSLRHKKVESCILNKLKAWKFPKPHGGVNVHVTYPFILKRVNQG